MQLLGDVLLELGQWDDAVSAFKKALALDPQSGRANFGLARAYAALKTDAAQCQAALDALERAVQFGLRDRSIHYRQVLCLNDGAELEGYVTEEVIDGIAEYILQQGQLPPCRYAKDKVKEVRRAPGLREELLSLLERFERGESPPPRKIIRGSRPAKPARTDLLPSTWGSGTILGN